MFPLSKYLRELVLFHRFFPDDHVITRDEVVTMPELGKGLLQLYFNYTFPATFSQDNYQAMKYLLLLVKRVSECIPCGSCVLAPGDSPSKIVQLLKWIYPGRNVVYIAFPLSGLQHEERTPELDLYLSKVLHNIEIKDLIFLDHIEEGSTYQAIKDSLRGITKNQHLKLRKIELEDFWERISTLDDNTRPAYQYLISESEILSTRGIPFYYLDKGLVNNTNTLRYNVVLSMLYLLHLRRITNALPFISVNQQEVTSLINKHYQMTYYDLDENKISTRNVLVVKLDSQGKLICKKILPRVKEFRDISILKDTLISASPLKYQTIDKIESYHNRFVQVTLVNDVVFSAWYDQFFDIGTGDRLSIHHALIQELDYAFNPGTPFDLTPYYQTICEIAHFCNGGVVFEEVYITDFSGHLVGYRKSKDFVTTFNFYARKNINRNLIYHARMLKPRSNLSLPFGKAIVKYQGKEAQGDWQPDSNSSCYSSDEISIIAPLIENITLK